MEMRLNFKLMNDQVQNIIYFILTRPNIMVWIKYLWAEINYVQLNQIAISLFTTHPLFGHTLRGCVTYVSNRV